MPESISLKIEKLVHGGQGLGVLPDGRKVFVWNTLPGEEVAVRLTKKRKDYAEAIVEEIFKPSSHRIEPKDEAYMSTSPWQIMDFEAENHFKADILIETIRREKVALNKDIDMYSDSVMWEYRNKMEYSFWADDNGLHLALFHRGTHGKRVVTGSSIARPEIDKTANRILGALNTAGIRGSQLKTVIVRCDQDGNTVAALFVKDPEFPGVQALQEICRGLEVVYSNPKSPASVRTKSLYVWGDIELSDTLLGTEIHYDVHSFFQVNLPVFEWVLKRIDYLLDGQEKVDLYCGVGTIGLSIGMTKVFVDIDENNCGYVRKNIDRRGKVVQASSEQALDYISNKHALIVDPPRAGLHQKLIKRINESRPPSIAYLSCNPSTQARDLALLQDNYKLQTLEGYNFFPRTPHIESLAVLVQK